MSTNDKNKIRSAFLKNFTEHRLKKIIVVSESYRTKSEFYDKIGDLNENINDIIQKLNLLIKNRHLPYIIANPYFIPNKKEILNKDTRIIVGKDPFDPIYDGYIKEDIAASRDSISHIVDILLANDRCLFRVSFLSCDAGLVIDDLYFNQAIEDIFLDISMFNSYSFLESMNEENRRKFSRQKLEFCKNKEISFYEIEEGDQQYFSLAFAARDEKGELDLERYIDLWQEFLKTYYPNKKHIEKDISSQLKRHVDKEELPKNLISKVSQNSSGAYLLLRTNKDRTETIHSQLYTLFGTNKSHYKKGLIKIVPISEFDTVKPLLENLDVSAFKIIV